MRHEARAVRSMMDIMKRTQLNIEDDLWKTLHMLARQSGCTISELVRKALREKYLNDAATRKEALLSAVGLWKDRTDLPDTEGYIRGLRKDDRPANIEVTLAEIRYGMRESERELIDRTFSATTSAHRDRDRIAGRDSGMFFPLVIRSLKATP
jgi:hypothetical protein